MLNLLSGKLEPTSGEITRHRRLRIGRYDQHFHELLPAAKSPCDFLRSEYDVSEQAARKVRKRGAVWAKLPLKLLTCVCETAAQICGLSTLRGTRRLGCELLPLPVFRRVCERKMCLAAACHKCICTQRALSALL